MERSYVCQCETGFEKESPESACEDIDECSSPANSFTGPFEECKLELGSCYCPCVSEEFHRVTQNSNCSDIDERETESSDALEICTNIIGNFTCECNVGFF